MMELDELKQKWAEHDLKLDVSIRLSRHLLTSARMDPARSALRRMASFLCLEAVVAFAVIVALGSFIGDHFGSPRFVVPAVVLDVFEIATLIGLGQQLRLTLDIDYGKPIAAIQKQLAVLRILSVRSTQWTLLLAPLLWTPLLIVALKGLGGVDVYQVLGSSYLVANLLFGMGVIPLGIWLSKAFADRMGGSPIMRTLMRSLAGYNLNEATDFLSRVSDFEEEELRSGM